jgi:polyisoprenoid-binding protein YceI
VAPLLFGRSRRRRAEAVPDVLPDLRVDTSARPDPEVPVVVPVSVATPDPGYTGPSVRGRVTSPDGWPLPGSTVTVVAQGGRQVGRGAVDDTGEFEVPVPAGGAVTVILAAAGVDPVARLVTVGADGAGDLGLVVLGNAQRHALPAPGVWAIDPMHSFLRASARHLGLSMVEGRFTAFSGEVRVADPIERSEVQVTITAASIDTGTGDRDGHLRSPDFLDVERFPFLTYRSTGLTHVAGERWRVDGVLTIRDIAREVPLDLTYLGTGHDPWGGSRVAFIAKTRLALRDYAMHWNMALPDGLTVVGPTLRIDMDVEAIRIDEQRGDWPPGPH